MDKFVTWKTTTTTTTTTTTVDGASSSSSSSCCPKPTSKGPATKRARSGRGPPTYPWVRCPECGDLVAESVIVEHLTGPACKPKTTTKSAPAGVAPPGLRVFDDFVSEAEEAALLAFLDSTAWRPGTFNGPTRRKAWGVRTDLAKRTFAPPLTPMPATPLVPFVQRMRDTCADLLRDFRPNEANAIDYRKARGDYLGAHCDDRRLSGAILVNLSLAGDATMSYTLDAGKKKTKEKPLPRQHRVLLKRRSLQVQTGTIRYDYSHAIAPEDLHDPRRVSLTFRMNLDAGPHPDHCV